jgi:phosphinothricin acetyltransferase
MSPEILRTARPEDAAAVAAIYNHYVRHTIITFEEQEVSVEAMRARIDEITSTHPWLLADDGEVVGYAHAYPWKTRSAYRHTVESGVYLRPDAVGHGRGTRLYTELLRLLREGGVHAVIAGIALPNPASVALHERLGFQPVGCLREVGFKLGRWIDVGYWEVVFDSPGGRP